MNNLKDRVQPEMNDECKGCPLSSPTIIYLWQWNQHGEMIEVVSVLLFFF